ILRMGLIPKAPKPKGGRPRNFRKKVKRLKELCRDMPRLKHLHQTAREFSPKVLLAGQKRHALVHSNWQSFVLGAAEPTVRFANVIWDGDDATPMKRDVPLSE